MQVITISSKCAEAIIVKPSIRMSLGSNLDSMPQIFRMNSDILLLGPRPLTAKLFRIYPCILLLDTVNGDVLRRPK